ncbi:Zinc finger SWIM domain-containing protein 7 [Microtus ochrogaster]|uniref:Zinc finger SWIM domain-containing protein 7 n=1 Tax=Microtus ochrogaster TaxID=79684 RepID=A0A8J6G4F6_MICOH|nr:Zinc finger SWIM domain-containing protein 7 [Microtus ochrogaster]
MPPARPQRTTSCGWRGMPRLAACAMTSADVTPPRPASRPGAREEFAASRRRTRAACHGGHAAGGRGGAPERDGCRCAGRREKLKFVFGSSAIQALDLVDRESVTLISSPSGRRVYQVVGSSGKTYTCLASCHYCSCPAFAFSVLRKSDSLLCKHLLAIYLSQVMRSCQQLSVSDKQLTDLLLMEKTQEA